MNNQNWVQPTPVNLRTSSDAELRRRKLFGKLTPADKEEMWRAVEMFVEQWKIKGSPNLPTGDILYFVAQEPERIREALSYILVQRTSFLAP